MPGDYSRFRFAAKDSFNAVLLQQGRVLLDSDYNEFVEILDRRFRSETVDLIGRVEKKTSFAVVPMWNPGAFELTYEIPKNKKDKTWMIGRGRLYLDGLQVENFGTGDLEWDPVLAEQRALGPTPYDEQPFRPKILAVPRPYDLPPIGRDIPVGRDILFSRRRPPQIPSFPSGRCLVYLRAWNREVTHLENPEIRERAVGVDTVTQVQTAWQVNVIEKLPVEITCAKLQDWEPWNKTTAPSAGRLTTATVGKQDPSDPCYLNPSGGYRGHENRLYRLEVHDGGALGTATLKWSRDNASVGTSVTAINDTRNVLTVSQTKWDRILRFSAGDWIEITDDVREFSKLPGLMRKVKDVDDTDLTITLKEALPAGEFSVSGVADPNRHTRVRRWDQKDKILNPAGVVMRDVDVRFADTDPGVIKTIAGAPFEFIIEQGIVATVSIEGTGELKSGDYWIFAARTADASIDLLDKAPPRGIHYHYCPLAIVENGNKLNECRTFWPPQTAGDCCECTVCVTAEGHNSGKLTIKTAIEKVKPTGGRVCLAPGVYVVTEQIKLNAASSLILTGCGMQTILLYDGGPGAAIDITDSRSVRIERVVVASYMKAPELASEIQKIYKDRGGDDALFALLGADTAPGATALSISNSTSVTVDRCLLLQKAPERASQPLMALSHFVSDVTLSKSLLIGGTGVRTQAQDNREMRLGTLSCGLNISRNLFVCAQAGIDFDTSTLYFLQHTIHDNTIMGCSAAAIQAHGIVLSGDGGTSRFDITGNILHASGHGIVAGLDDLTISGNTISAGENLGKIVPDKAGIQIYTQTVFHDVPPGIERCHILENRIVGCSGYGIRIESDVISMMIKQNFIERIGAAGIYVGSKAKLGEIAIENNQFRHIGNAAHDKTPYACGIVLQGVESGVVAGNSFRDIANTSTKPITCSAISVHACTRVQVCGNSAENIGPAESKSGVTAVFDVTAPVTAVEFDRNRVIGATALTPDSKWYALRMSPAIDPLRKKESPAYLFARFVYAPSGVEASGMKAAPKAKQPFDRETDSVLMTSGGLVVLRGHENHLTATGNYVQGSSIVPLIAVSAHNARICDNVIECGSLTSAVALNARKELIFDRNTVNRSVEGVDKGVEDVAKISGEVVVERVSEVMVVLLATDQCKITGNRLTGFGRQAALYAISQKSVCQCTDNHVDYELFGRSELLLIKAPMAIFSSNYVKSQAESSKVSILVEKTTAPDPKKETPDRHHCTVLGNIIAGRATLWVNDNLLSDPWKPLNLIL